MGYYFSPFRREYKPEGSADLCAFCDPNGIQRMGVRNTDGKLVENEYYFWYVNYYPRADGHTMVIPKKHLLYFKDETPAEVYARHHLLTYVQKIFSQLVPGSGVDIFLQTGPGSDSTVKHLHWHILPSLPSDALRGFEKLGSFVTPNEKEEKIILFPQEIKLARENLLQALAPIVQEYPYAL